MKTQIAPAVAIVVGLVLPMPASVTPLRAQPETELLACVTPPDGLVSWWSWDGSGADILGLNPASLIGGPRFTQGIVAQAIALDGVDDYGTVAASESLDVGAGNGFTIDLWFNTSDAIEQQALVEWNNGIGEGFGAHFWTSVGSPGSLLANLFDTSGTQHVISSIGGLISANVNYHTAVTYDKSGGMAKLYLNGVVVSSLFIGNFTPQTSYNLYFGARPPVAYANRFSGWLDEVDLFNRALSETEIQAIYNAGNAGKCKPPIFVASIDPFARLVGDQYRLGTTVTIRDPGNLAIPGAKVSIEVTYPDGDAITVVSKTNAEGRVGYSFLTSQLGTYVFTVVDVRKISWIYDESLNVETSDTITVP